MLERDSFFRKGFGGKRSKGRPAGSSKFVELWILRTIAEKDGAELYDIRVALKSGLSIADKRGIQRRLNKLKKGGLLENPYFSRWQLPKSLSAYARIFKLFYLWFRFQLMSSSSAQRLTVLQLSDYHRKMRKRYGDKKLHKIFLGAEAEAVDMLRRRERWGTTFRLLMILAREPAGMKSADFYRLAEEELRIQKSATQIYLKKIVTNKIITIKKSGQRIVSWMISDTPEAYAYVYLWCHGLGEITPKKFLSSKYAKYMRKKHGKEKLDNAVYEEARNTEPEEHYDISALGLGYNSE